MDKEEVSSEGEGQEAERIIVTEIIINILQFIF